MEKRGSLLVISGFSGVGKGTVAKKLVEKYGYSLSISATTRQPREGEVDGREYFFKTVDDFKNLIDYNGFIEYARYVDNYYGTPRKFVEDELAAGEQLALKEQFPSLFKSGNYIRFYDYDFNWPARIPYMTAVQRETADIVLFHHHGADDTQYLNGYPEGSGVNLSIDNIKRYLRSKVLTAYERKKDVMQGW